VTRSAAERPTQDTSETGSPEPPVDDDRSADPDTGNTDASHVPTHQNPVQPPEPAT
jgi:hypothetical protein